ncbi:hypothetical protein PYW08_013684 [Mythimna loreyi]|uniref:Uncharacterized protein n=1 Tax=Mythimna loreyi TaxID=667449 RepID=A0ACC2R655_9NEOP|nr:hypothetical protein PYW08_013684 [Mythimna loreyi]
MLLSNPSARPDQDRRTLTQLGDSLLSRGLLYSAQFCYVSAGVPLARHPLAPLMARVGAPPRLALLLADSRATTLQQLAHNKALFATEVYEYAMSLNQEDFVITELQPYKFVLACRLLDVGLYERALAYTEACARAVTRAPQLYSSALVSNLAELADRLKYHDPSLQEDPPLVDEADSSEPSPRHHQQWLADVKQVAHMLTAESASQQTTPQHNNYEQPPHNYEQPQHNYEQPQHAYEQPQQQYGWADQQNQQYQQAMPTYPEPAAEEASEYAQQYYPPPQAPPDDAPPQPSYDEWPRADDAPANYWQPEPAQGYSEGAGDADAAPTITMPGSNKPRAPYYQDYDDQPSDQQNERDTDSPKASSKKQEGKSKQEGKQARAAGAGGGWLGGILTKLSLRPPNQMILPDDKNPSIVWDAEHKRWRNLDGDSDDSEPPPPPPPRSAPAPHAQSTSPPLPSASGAPPALGAPPVPGAPVSNIFKMQKGRHIKKSYVDVFNPSGAPTRALPPASDVLGPSAPLTAPTNYFVPAPVPQSGIYDPSKLEGDADPSERSGI